jgi:hypothetical protein
MTRAWVMVSSVWHTRFAKSDFPFVWIRNWFSKYLPKGLVTLWDYIESHARLIPGDDARMHYRNVEWMPLLSVDENDVELYDVEDDIMI